METIFTLLYIPTGYKYKLSKEECDKFILEDKDNFKVLEKEYVPPVDEEISNIESIVVGLEKSTKSVEKKQSSNSMLDMLISKGT